MFVFRALSVSIALSIITVAHPTSHVEFEKDIAEKLKAAPAGWVQDISEKVDKDATLITLKIHLVNKDMDKFHEHAMNVCTYNSERKSWLMLTSS
jgi:tripeptidyl-peptidase-1